MAVNDINLDDLPDWADSDHVFGCWPCWEEGVCVPIGLGKKAYFVFARNALQLTCPRCSHSLPRHSTRYGKSYRIKWVPLHLQGYQKQLTEKEIWRIPLRNDRGHWEDDLKFGAPNSMPQTAYSLVGNTGPARHDTPDKTDS